MLHDDRHQGGSAHFQEAVYWNAVHLKYEQTSSEINLSIFYVFLSKFSTNLLLIILF